MTKKQEEPAPPLTVERKTTLRLTHSDIEKILREALTMPADATFGTEDYCLSIPDCCFVWSSVEPFFAARAVDTGLLASEEIAEVEREMRAPGRVDAFVAIDPKRGLEP